MGPLARKQTLRSQFTGDKCNKTFVLKDHIKLCLNNQEVLINKAVSKNGTSHAKTCLTVSVRKAECTASEPMRNG